MDFGMRPPRIREVDLLETPSFLVKLWNSEVVLRNLRSLMARPGGVVIDTQAFLTLDLELRGRFASSACRAWACLRKLNYLHQHYWWPWSCRRTIL